MPESDETGDLHAWRERALAAEAWRDEAWAPLQRRLAEAECLEARARRADELEGSAWFRATRTLHDLRWAVRRRLRRAR
jgi:hypothetical protein